MRINPLICFYTKDGRFYVENLYTHRTFEVKSDILGKLSSLLHFKKKKIMIKSPAIKSLKREGIIISNKLYKNLSNNFKVWGKHNWWVALLYYLSTENISNIADRESSGPQTLILKDYLKNDSISFYKDYTGSKIKLPFPDKIKNIDLSTLLLKRRTFRDFKKPIDIKELSSIFYHSCKEMRFLRNFQIKNYKTNPKVLLKSLYSPFEIYLVINDVTGLKSGIYHLDTRNNSLDVIALGKYGKEIAKIAQGQMFVANASITVLIAGVFKRYMFRYRQPRAYRDILTTVAELAQRIIIYSTYFGVKTFETPAIKDTEIQKVLGLKDWEEESLYLLALGK